MRKTCLLMLVWGFFSHALGGTLPADLIASDVDTIAAYEAALLSDIEMYKAESDSLLIEVRMREIEIAALEANQRRWFDEPMVFVKVLALALAAKWLNDG